MKITVKKKGAVMVLRRSSAPVVEIKKREKTAAIEVTARKSKATSPRNRNALSTFLHEDGEKGEEKGAKRRVPSLRQIDRQIKLVLTELMDASNSDAVRVAAAKALMDKLNKKQDEDDEASQHEREERHAALHEARSLLAELAIAQFGGICGATSLGQSGPARPADAKG